MGRGKSISAPSYRKHKSTGQAVVRINGKDHYLGKYGTEKSKQRYEQALADLWNTPGTAPKLRLPTSELATLSDLAIEFGQYASQKYGDKPEWKHQIKPVLKTFRATYGHLLASEFGPVRFENFRQSLVQQGLSRAVVKRKSNYIIKMFQRGVKLELIPVELWQRLLAAGPVEMNTKPKKKRWAVPDKIVDATIAELTPILADMVILQRFIGARPSEVCNLRPCDIDRSDEVWIYTPASHKTEHHGHGRSIPIGPQAQVILTKYLFRDPQAFCFTPAEAYEQHQSKRHEYRKTPMNQGNKPKQKKPPTFKPNYDHNSYRRAIQRAALRAFPIPEGNTKEQEAAWKAEYAWRPNQLRKSAATTARKEMDLETAQKLLGHSSKATTEAYYAELTDERAIDFARKYG